MSNIDSFNTVIGERFIPESDTLNDIVNVRKRKRDTPPRRREMSLDQREQKELELLEDYGTDLLEERGTILTVVSCLYTQWSAAKNNGDECMYKAIMLALTANQLELAEIDMEIDVVVYFQIRIKAVFRSEEPDLDIFPPTK